MAHKLWAKRVLVKALPSYLFSWPFSSSFNCPKALSKVSLTELNEILSSVFELIFEKKKKSKRREKVKGNYFYLILNSGEFLQELIWSDHKLFSSCRTDQSKITKSCRWCTIMENTLRRYFEKFSIRYDFDKFLDGPIICRSFCGYKEVGFL